MSVTSGANTTRKLAPLAMKILAPSSTGSASSPSGTRSPLVVANPHYQDSAGVFVAPIGLEFDKNLVRVRVVSDV